jgi:hypothetical protein
VHEPADVSRFAVAHAPHPPENLTNRRH